MLTDLLRLGTVYTRLMLGAKMETPVKSKK
jgi:hypothetical protein